MTILKKRLVQSALLVCAWAGVASVAVAKPYKGAEIFTSEEQTYGKYVIRMRAAKGSGIISNFFLWKDGSELEDVFWEEVDVEVFGKDNATSWQSNIITGLGSRNTSEDVHQNPQSFGDTYNTFTLEWTPEHIQWSVNGQVVRTSTDSQAREIMNPAQLRLNFWPPEVPSWVGSWDDSILPVYMYVNWVEYYNWNGDGFELAWRDDFDYFDSNRWGKADWTFAENRADFAPENAVVSNGYLVLAMTHEGQEGFNGTPPEDQSGTPSSSSSISSSSSSSSSVSTSSSSSSSSLSSSSSSSSANNGGTGGGAFNIAALFALSLLLFATRARRLRFASGH